MIKTRCNKCKHCKDYIEFEKPSYGRLCAGCDAMRYAVVNCELRDKREDERFNDYDTHYCTNFEEIKNE